MLLGISPDERPMGISPDEHMLLLLLLTNTKVLALGATAASAGETISGTFN
jgi:hypothetical protein